jgi:hypothetical protein
MFSNMSDGVPAATRCGDRRACAIPRELLARHFVKQHGRERAPRTMLISDRSLGGLLATGCLLLAKFPFLESFFSSRVYIFE